MHPVKSIAAGEGGVVTTNDQEIYESLLRLRSHGINKNNDAFLNIENAYTDSKKNLWYYEMRVLGYHYRFTDIQAALANSQLKKLDMFMKKRQEIAERYKQFFSTCRNVELAQAVNIKNSANHLFTISIDFQGLSFSRNQLMSSLRDHGIITQVHYIPLPLHPFYEQKGFDCKKLTNSLNYYNSCLSVPIYFGLSNEDQEYFIDKLVSLIDELSNGEAIMDDKLDRSLWKRAKSVIPGGNQLLSKRPEMFLPEFWPTYFSKTSGVNVWDLEGKCFLDMCLMGVGTNSLGYGNDGVDQAVMSVVSKGNMSTLNCAEEVFGRETSLSSSMV